MVKRRKVLIGAGSLLAGGAAATGTGAIQESDLNRGLTGRVAGDRNGYIGLLPGSIGRSHVRYNDGKMTLDFGAFEDGGNGLNPDSVNYFDMVFQVKINGPNDYYDGNDTDEEGDDNNNDRDEFVVWVTEDTNANRAIDFYRSKDPNRSMVGSGNAERINDGSEKIYIGVCIDLRGEGMSPGDSLSTLFGEDAEFTIHVEQDEGAGPSAAPTAD